MAEYARVNAAKILRQMESTGNTADAIAPKPVAAMKPTKKPESEWFDQKDAAYRCQICEEVILCQRSEIEGHLVGAHRLSLEDYSGKYHPKEQEKSKGGGRDLSKRKKLLKGRTKTPGPKSKTMLVDSDDDDEEEPETENEQSNQEKKKSTPGPKSKTERKTPGPKSKTLKQDEPQATSDLTIQKENDRPKEAEKVENDTSWRDACKFACNYCSEEMASRYAMVSHCKREHGNDGTTKHYKVASRVEHECLVCKKPVMHENKNLTDHMHKSHKFNLITYEERYYFPSLMGAKSDNNVSSETAQVESKANKKSDELKKQVALPQNPEPPTDGSQKARESSKKPKKIILVKTASSENAPEEQPRPRQTSKRKLEFSDFSSGNKENASGGEGGAPQGPISRMSSILDGAGMEVEVASAGEPPKPKPATGLATSRRSLPVTAATRVEKRLAAKQGSDSVPSRNFTLFLTLIQDSV